MTRIVRRCASGKGWWAWLPAIALVLTLAGAFAADSYPPLTGRVVDNAVVLTPSSRDALAGKLKALEDRSGIQLVVATVPSLGGQAIEPFANGLFRFWKLGEGKKNNGVLLLVAPTERRVRIEVGYGLEGTLTDALSKIIITNAMVPRFKTGDFAGGIERGTDDIIAVLSTDTSDWQKRPEFRAEDNDTQVNGLMIALVVIVIVVLFLLLGRQIGRRGGPGGGIVVLPTGGSGWSGGGFSDGGAGFSGGGGSSGGGGASGGW